MVNFVYYESIRTKFQRNRYINTDCTFGFAIRYMYINFAFKASTNIVVKVRVLFYSGKLKKLPTRSRKRTARGVKYNGNIFRIEKPRRRYRINCSFKSDSIIAHLEPKFIHVAKLKEKVVLTTVRITPTFAFWLANDEVLARVFNSLSTNTRYFFATISITV